MPENARGIIPARKRLLPLIFLIGASMPLAARAIAMAMLCVLFFVRRILTIGPHWWPVVARGRRWRPPSCAAVATPCRSFATCSAGPSTGRPTPPGSPTSTTCSSLDGSVRSRSSPRCSVVTRVRTQGATSWSGGAACCRSRTTTSPSPTPPPPPVGGWPSSSRSCRPTRRRAHRPDRVEPQRRLQPRPGDPRARPGHRPRADRRRADHRHRPLARRRRADRCASTPTPASASRSSPSSTPTSPPTTGRPTSCSTSARPGTGSRVTATSSCSATSATRGRRAARSAPDAFRRYRDGLPSVIGGFERRRPHMESAVPRARRRRRRPRRTCTWRGTSRWPARNNVSGRMRFIRDDASPVSAHVRRRSRSHRRRQPRPRRGAAGRRHVHRAALPHRQRLARQPLHTPAPTACRRATAPITAHFTCIVPDRRARRHRPVPWSTATACSAAATRSTPATSGAMAVDHDMVVLRDRLDRHGRRRTSPTPPSSSATCRSSRRSPIARSRASSTRCSSPVC